jgi:Rap1a immunity proteins
MINGAMAKTNNSRLLPRPAMTATAVSLLVMAPNASNAALMSAPDLLTACSGDAVAKATCNGYLMAVTDAVLLRESRGGGRSCVPETVTVDQVRDAVLNVSARRAAHAGTALRLVTGAMRVTWPCTGTSGGALPEAPKSQ